MNPNNKRLRRKGHLARLMAGGKIVQQYPVRLPETEYPCPGPLKGRLLICFFEGTHTIHTFAFNPSGTAITDNRPLLAEDNDSLRLTQPIDVTVHPSGRIYVADFGNWGSFGGGGTIWGLNPVGWR